MREREREREREIEKKEREDTQQHFRKPLGEPSELLGAQRKKGATHFCVLIPDREL